jgi:hypothetical protein
MSYLWELFGRRNAPGIAMAVRALRLAISRDEITAVAIDYIGRLRAVFEEA